MQIRLLIATPANRFEALLCRTLRAALALIPLDVTTEIVKSREELTNRLRLDQDDVVFLDWALAEAETPLLVQQILADNRRLRLVALLPLHLRQYRQALWAAGACSSIPKEHIDQERVSSLLCVMRRAMEREARLLQTYRTEGAL